MDKAKNLWKAVRIPLLAILCSLVAGGVIIALTGSNPFVAYYSLLQGCGLAPKASYAGYKSILTDFMSYVNYFTPMIFAALAVAVALRAGLFNIGVSGQMLAAGFTATIVAGYSGLNGVLAKPLVILIGIAAGGIVGALIGVLKYRFNINEVVSSIMLNYIIQYVVSFFINTCYVDPVSRQSKEVSAASRLTLMDTPAGNLKMDIPLGIILALVTVVLVWLLLEKTRIGYELKAVGFSRSAAKYAGIRVGKNMVLAMTISGALGGLAGVTYYLGYVGSIQPKVLISTGFDAIAVSLLGNNNPFGIIFSTMLITLISKGSTYMKSTAGVDAEIASVITGIILLFSACNVYIRWKLEHVRREKEARERQSMASSLSGGPQESAGKAGESRKAEEIRKAGESRNAEESRKARESRNAEESRKAGESQKSHGAGKAEDNQADAVKADLDQVDTSLGKEER